jgi:hypothetical protein
MEIENAKGIFDLGDDKITVERTNPLLNDQGSLSLTYPIKRTPNNDYLLGFPHKYSRKAKYDIKTDVNIRAGLLNENATLQMTSVDSDQIEATFLLYESTFYAKIKEVTLPTVFEGVERWFDAETVPVATRIANIVATLQTMISRNPVYDYDKDFTIFPVTNSLDIENATDFGAIDLVPISVSRLNLINAVKYTASGVELIASNSFTVKDDDNNQIAVPVGYGISPFLRMGYILRKAFEYFGLNLEQNMFDYGNNKYRRVVVLNNTQDAIMKGYLIESQLVPDCTVNEFLNIIREAFNAEFFIDVPSKTAKLVFFEDIMGAAPDMDLSAYLTEDPAIEFANAVSVKLAVGTSLPSATTSTETFPQFKAKYSGYSDSFPGIMNEGIYPNFAKNTIRNKSVPDYIGGTSSDYRAILLSSLNFQVYDETIDVDYEEHTIPVEAPVGVWAYASDGNTDGQYVAMIGDFRRLNTHLVLNNVAQKEDETANNSAIWALDSYALLTPGSTLVRRGQMMDDNVNGLSLHTWGTQGLFAKFWNNYDKLLRNSWHTVTAQCRIPAKVLQSWDFTRMKLLDGQLMIANKLTYELTDDPVIDVEIELKTAKIYE